MLTTKYRAKYIANIYKSYLKPEDKILDIGCGNGIVSKILIDNLRLKIVGTDIHYYLKEDIEFKKMESEKNLPFASHSFDWTLFNDVLHHCYDQKSLINEALRVADKVLIFEVKPSFLAKIIDLVINLFHNIKMPKPLNFLTLKQWQDLLAEIDCQFEIIKLKKPFFFYPIKNFLIVLKNK